MIGRVTRSMYDVGRYQTRERMRFLYGVDVHAYGYGNEPVYTVDNSQCTIPRALLEKQRIYPPLSTV